MLPMGSQAILVWFGQTGAMLQVASRLARHFIKDLVDFAKGMPENVRRSIGTRGESAYQAVDLLFRLLLVANERR